MAGAEIDLGVEAGVCLRVEVEAGRGVDVRNYGRAEDGGRIGHGRAGIVDAVIAAEQVRENRHDDFSFAFNNWAGAKNGRSTRGVAASAVLEGRRSAGVNCARSSQINHEWAAATSAGGGLRPSATEV
jgi:hypothetical protein